MKPLLTVAALIFASVGLYAQQSYFNVGNFNKELPGKILRKGGQIEEVNMVYEHPDFLKLPARPLKISGGQVDKKELEAFTLDGRTWVPRNAPTGSYWVILSRQGAIEVYDYLTSDSKGEITSVITVGTVVRKGTTQLTNTDLMMGYKKKLTPLVSDNPELAVKVGEKGYGFIQYLNVVDEYNAWYEKGNPGKTAYLPAALGVALPAGAVDKGPSGVAEMKEQMKSNNEQTAQANQAKLDDLFAGRSSSVSPELASAKDNVPVKKETFKGKMQRIKSDGNKVGVLLMLNPVRVNQDPTSNMMEETIAIEGQFMDESLRVAGRQLADELNAALGIQDVELIDLSKIPYRDVKVMGMTTRVDDWWATKYKLVFAYSVDPRLKTSHALSGGSPKFNASLNMVTSMIITEYIGPVTSTKQDIVSQTLNMGSFMTPVFEQTEDMSDVRLIYGKVQEKQGMTMADKLKAERQDAVKKLVEKKLSQ